MRVILQEGPEHNIETDNETYQPPEFNLKEIGIGEYVCKW